MALLIEQTPTHQLNFDIKLTSEIRKEDAHQ